MLKVTMYILAISSILKSGALAQVEAEENCETLQSEIHIAKGSNQVYTCHFNLEFIYLFMFAILL